jgi:hypothetical protein
MTINFAISLNYPLCMALIELEQQTDYLRHYLLVDGRVVTFEIEEDGTEIRVLTAAGKSIGRFEFKNMPDEDDDEIVYSKSTEPWVKLMLMDLEGENCSYLYAGIGPMCLEVYTDLFDLPISAARFDQPDIGDGSHLVGDGPAFVRKMIDAGLLQDNNEDEDEDNYTDEEE